MKKIIKILVLSLFIIFSIIFCLLYYEFFCRSTTLNEKDVFPGAISLTIENKTPEEVYVVINHFYTPNEISINNKNNYIETYYYHNDTIRIDRIGKYSNNIHLTLSSFEGNIKVLPNDFCLIFMDSEKKIIYILDEKKFFKKFKSIEWKIIIKKEKGKFILGV